MKTPLSTVLAMMCVALIFLGFSTGFEMENNLQSTGAPGWFVIEGLVENPLNLTYTELTNFPLLSEVTMLQCAGSGQPPYGPSVIYNWTGVPLFHFLSMAKVIAGDYREVVFVATDGFSSSVTLETAMDPTTILALEANGTDLEQMEGFGSGYRVVLPCRWGYKWVKWINQIIVVDYDYKGTYEQWGYPDEAIIPNCTMPLTNPPRQTFSAGKSGEHSVQILSNSTIESFSFEGDTLLTFNVSGPEETIGYFYFMFPKELLNGPYLVYVDHNPVNYSQTDADGNIYLVFNYTHSTSIIEIEGTDPQASTSRKLVSFNVDSNPRMMLYSPNRGIVWVALAGERRVDHSKWNRELGIAGVNVTSLDYEVYTPPLPAAEVNGTSGFISIDDDYGKIWTTIEYGQEGSVYRYLAYFDTNTFEWTITNIELQYAPVYFCNGFVWGFRRIQVNLTYAYTQILKIYPETVEVVARYNWTYLHHVEGPSIINVSDNFWFSTDYENEYGKWVKKLIKFNITKGEEVISVTDLDSPAGLEYKDGIIYVAELKEESYVRETIALVDEQTGEVLGRIILPHITQATKTGVYSLKFDSNGNLWWVDKYGEATANYSHAGAINRWLNKTYHGIGASNYFMEEVENTIWFTSKGSAYIEELRKFKDPDVTGDGYVGIDDIVAVAEHFGTEDEEYDLTGDNYVGVDDIVLTAEYFGEQI